LLSFTGSPVVGWEMKKNAGKKKVVLELGGNAGVIVSKSADMDDAVKKCLIAGFAYSGQICIHAQRIFVQEDVFDGFKERFIAGVLALKQGDPKDASTDISVMIDEENAVRVEKWIQEAVTGGAEVLCGGVRNGTYVPPTVLTSTTTSMKVCAEEIFGPVVTLEKFVTFDLALEAINNSKFGLQAGVFTNDISEGEYAFNTIEAGGVILNDVPTVRLDHMPYGGVKESGLGREGVKYAILDMMEARILVK
jgi:acyl-CoA reductase-like NAD-dependent aldehyde dehydrogenase